MQIEIDASDLVDLARHYDNAPAKAKKALARAINHTGNVAMTRVRRALVKQTGAAYGKIKDEVTGVNGNVGSPTYQIVARGRAMGLVHFNARETRKGVSARPWGKRRVFGGTFIARGQVYKRVGKGRLPIEKLWGPSIPTELVKDASVFEFMATVRERLPARVAHELSRAGLGGR